MQPPNKTDQMFIPLLRAVEEGGRRMVWGYASTETPGTSGGLILENAAVAAVLPDFMKFGNIREMHKESAAGNVKPGDAVIDEKGLYIGAQIDDDQAWKKVIGGTYKGFSVGIVYKPGKVKSNRIGAEAIVRMNEISLADRPEVEDTTFDRVSLENIAHRNIERNDSAPAETAPAAAATIPEDTQMHLKVAAVLNRTLGHVGQVLMNLDDLSRLGDHAEAVGAACSAKNIKSMVEMMSPLALKHLNEVIAAAKSKKGDELDEEEAAEADNCLGAMDAAMKVALPADGLKELARVIGEWTAKIEAPAPVVAAPLADEAVAQRIAAADAKVAELDPKVADLTRIVGERDAQVTELTRTVEAKETELVALRAMPSGSGAKFAAPSKEDDVIEVTEEQRTANAAQIADLKRELRMGGERGRLASIELTRLHHNGVVVG